MGRESVQPVRHCGRRGGWPGYRPGAALVDEVQRSDDAAQLSLWAGFLGQRIVVGATRVGLHYPDAPMRNAWCTGQIPCELCVVANYCTARHAVICGDAHDRLDTIFFEGVA